MIALKIVDPSSIPLRTRIFATPQHADRLRALAIDAGCAVEGNETVPSSAPCADPDLVLCDTAVWRSGRTPILDAYPDCAVVVVDTDGDLDADVVQDPLVDDWVGLESEGDRVRLRLQRAISRRAGKRVGFEAVGFAPGRVNGLRPLHGSLEALISALEAKDPHTRDHSHRVCATAMNLASQIAPGDPLFQERIRVASLFHDIGKIGVPEAVLNKPGALDPQEWAAVQRHVLCGVGILRPVVDAATLAMVRHHHERWDGKGYPDGVAGTDIPLGARIIAVADSWDAMTSARSYRPALAHRDVWDILREGAGSQWDPAIVEAFLGQQGRSHQRLAA